MLLIAVLEIFLAKSVLFNILTICAKLQKIIYQLGHCITITLRKAQ